MAKLAKPTKATEGYWKETLGFHDPCKTCGKVAKVVKFTYPTGPRTFALMCGKQYETTLFNFAIGFFCSFDCFKASSEYIGPRTEVAA